MMNARGGYGRPCFLARIYHDLLQAAQQLERLEFERFLNRLLAIRAQRKASATSHPEAELLLEINQGIPANLQNRYNALAQKRQVETLTDEDYRELLELTVNCWAIWAFSRCPMSERISSDFRQRVAERAEHCCEYCRSQAKFVVQSFAVEHIVPLSQGGLTMLDNLALACQGCNNHKYNKQVSIDPANNLPAPLFHPRQQQWHEHFCWNAGCCFPG